MSSMTFIDNGTVTVRGLTEQELAALAALAPTPEQIIAAARSAAVIDRGPLCMALYTAGILPGPSAIAASKGEWPPEFNSFLSGLPSAEQVYAQISWADAITVRYQNPLLQAAALAFCQGDAAAATALLDQLFGIGGMT